VPLVNQTARGIVSIFTMSAASLGSPADSSWVICWDAPSEGGGT
jgi:hypothetical protein